VGKIFSWKKIFFHDIVTEFMIILTPFRVFYERHTVSFKVSGALEQDICYGTAFTTGFAESHTDYWRSISPNTAPIEVESPELKLL